MKVGPAYNSFRPLTVHAQNNVANAQTSRAEAEEVLRKLIEEKHNATLAISHSADMPVLGQHLDLRA